MNIENYLEKTQFEISKKPPVVLTGNQLRGLELVEKFNANKLEFFQQATEYDKALLENFLFSSLGNMKFNLNLTNLIKSKEAEVSVNSRRIVKLKSELKKLRDENSDQKLIESKMQELSGLKEQRKINNLSIQSLSEMRQLTFKSRNYEKYIDVAVKVNTLKEFIEHDIMPSEEDKLTEKDAQILYEVITVKELLDKFFTPQQVSVPGIAGNVTFPPILDKEGSSPIKAVNYFVNMARENSQKLQVLYQQEIDKGNSYHSGDIGVYKSSSFQKFSGAKLNWESRLKSTFVTDYGHGLKIYRSTPNAEGTSSTNISHVVSSYEAEELTFSANVILDIWRVNINPLLNKDSPAYAHLEEMFSKKGVDVEAGIQSYYEEAERYLHEELQDRMKGIDNSKKRRVEAGLADIGLKGGHKNKRQTSDAFRKEFEFFYKGQGATSGQSKEGMESGTVNMICSEFVSKGMVAALIALDEMLTHELKEHLMQEKGLSKEDADLFIKYNKRDGLLFLSLPYDHTERLERVHPGRMVELLEKKKVISLVPKPSILKKSFLKRP